MAGIPEVEFIWKNGELVPWDQATTHVLSHSLNYGSAVFEGLRAYKTDKGAAIFRLRDHMERLVNSAKMTFMDIPYSVDELCEATIKVVKENNLPSCYIRPIAYRGYGSLGVDPRNAPVEIAIAAWPWEAYLGADALKHGVDVMVSSWRQRSANSTPPGIKAAGSYFNSALAHMEAEMNGFTEAILLNEDGKVCEGSGENLFIVKKGKVMTPPLSDGLLEGITRDSVITVAKDLGYEVLECSLVRSQLYTADEVFFTGSAAELTPIASVDRREVGKPGEITKAIQARFFDIVSGKVEEHKDWLTYVG
jgi:branched-chain amino acid aminotransferase